MKTSSRRKSDPVSFKCEQTFSSAPPVDFSLFLMGQNWVMCRHLNWSLEMGMGSCYWLRPGSIYLPHLGEKWTQEQNQALPSWRKGALGFWPKVQHANVSWVFIIHHTPFQIVSSLISVVPPTTLWRFGAINLTLQMRKLRLTGGK